MSHHKILIFVNGGKNRIMSTPDKLRTGEVAPNISPWGDTGKRLSAPSGAAVGPVSGSQTEGQTAWATADWSWSSVPFNSRDSPEQDNPSCCSQLTMTLLCSDVPVRAWRPVLWCWSCIDVHESCWTAKYSNWNEILSKILFYISTLLFILNCFIYLTALDTWIREIGFRLSSKG